MIVLSKTVAPFITRKVEKKWFGFVGGGGVFGWLVGFFVLFCCFGFFFFFVGRDFVLEYLHCFCPSLKFKSVQGLPA